jgi:sugar phosphate isomerase/epimerase
MSIPIGLQLYAVRGEVEANLPATLKALAEIGYVGAEPWGYNGETQAWMGHSADAIRSMYDDNGLKCCGIHLTTNALREDNLARSIAFNHTLGNRFLIIAMDPQRMTSTVGVAELAAILNDASEKLAPEGMFAGYHAHGFDAAPLEDGRIAWDALFSSTLPEVIMQMDIGNYTSGGGDAIDTLRRFPNRARSVHLKEYGGAPGAIIGEGDADWPEVFRLCETEQNTEWYVVEEGGADGFGFDVCKRSLAALRKMGK